MESVTQPPTAQEAGEGPSGVLDLSGLQSGLVEPSGEPSSTPYFSGDSSGTIDVSAESSAATSTSGEASGFPEVTLITSDFVEGVTEPTVSQELGQRPPLAHTPQIFESSGEASASGDISGATSRFPGSGVEASSFPEPGLETSAYPEPGVGASAAPEASGGASGSPDLSETTSAFDGAGLGGASGLGTSGSTSASQEGPTEGSPPSGVSGEPLRGTSTYDVVTETSGWASATATASGDRTELSGDPSGHTSGLGIVIGTSVPEFERTPQTQRPAEARLEFESSSPLHSGEEMQTAETATFLTDTSTPASPEGAGESGATTTGIVGISPCPPVNVFV